MIKGSSRLPESEEEGGGEEMGIVDGGVVLGISEAREGEGEEVGREASAMSCFGYQVGSSTLKPDIGARLSFSLF